MNAKEFTAKRRRKVQLPDGSEFVIRKVGVSDMMLSGGNSDLAVFLKVAQNPANIKIDEVRPIYERILKRAIVEPKGIDLSDLTFEECDLIFGAVLKFSNFTEELAKRLAPLSKTVASSSGSTPSPHATDASQVASSESKTPLNGGQSIRPAPAQDSTGKTDSTRS